MDFSGKIRPIFRNRVGLSRVGRWMPNFIWAKIMEKPACS